MHKSINVFFFFFSITLLFPSFVRANASYNKQHIEVSLRMIGHQILLNSGDSLSRVLPIRKENDKYRVQFESEFGFNPDEFVNTVNQVMFDSKMTNGYIVEVEQCETGDVVYSYEIGDREDEDIFPCMGRDQPKSCYSLLFTLKENDSASSQLQTETSDQQENSSTEKKKLNYSLLTVLGVLLVGAVALLKKKKNRSLSDPNMIPLGKFLFDKRNSELLIEKEKIELTSKEADLLHLLYKSVNTTVEREVILSEVWGDEGDYVGRTLDVFISKLRKKLEFDPKVKIVNIRGVGYKLILDVGN